MIERLIRALKPTFGADFENWEIGSVTAWTIHALIIAQEMDADKRVGNSGRLWESFIEALEGAKCGFLLYNSSSTASSRFSGQRGRAAIRAGNRGCNDMDGLKRCMIG